MTRTFFCVNTSRPQLFASASALCHVSRRCCVGLPLSTDPPRLSQVKVVPRRCSCTVRARSPEARHALSAPRVDELELFRVKNNKQGVMKIKTASPCFGQINTGVTTNGTGGNHGSSQGGLPLPGGAGRHISPTGSAKGTATGSVACTAVGTPMCPLRCCSSHGDGAGNAELFSQWYRALQSCARGARGETGAGGPETDTAFPLPFRNFFFIIFFS